MLDGFARSVDQRQGLLCLIPTAKPQGIGPRTGDPGSRAPRLGSRAMFLVNNLCLKYKEKGCLVSAMQNASLPWAALLGLWRGLEPGRYRHARNSDSTDVDDRNAGGG